MGNFGYYYTLTTKPAWKSVSVVTSALPERVWRVYAQLRWHEWDHDIESMAAAPTNSAPGLVDGNQFVIYMKDRTKHTVTLSDVVENERFAYAGPLTGSQLVAVHRLERCAEGTRITHSFEFTGFLGGIFRLAAAGPVQRGLEANTLMLRTLAEAAEEEPAAGGDDSGS